MFHSHNWLTELINPSKPYWYSLDSSHWELSDEYPCGWFIALWLNLLAYSRALNLKGNGIWEFWHSWGYRADWYTYVYSVGTFWDVWGVKDCILCICKSMGLKHSDICEGMGFDHLGIYARIEFEPCVTNDIVTFQHDDICKVWHLGT